MLRLDLNAAFERIVKCMQKTWGLSEYSLAKRRRDKGDAK